MKTDKLFQLCVQDSVDRIQSYVGDSEERINDDYVKQQLDYIDKMYKIFNKK